MTIDFTGIIFIDEVWTNISIINKQPMNNLLRGLIAGYGAKKLGGGCLGTVLVFILIWVALGQCS